MSYIFKINIIFLIVFHYLASSFFSSNIIIIGKNLIPIILIISWFLKLISIDDKKNLKVSVKIMFLFGLFFIFNFVY